MKRIYHLWSEPHGHAFCGVRVRVGPYYATHEAQAALASA